eukprot:jgi/Botrbrau1/12883/Bobra.0299s0003.1
MGSFMVRDSTFAAVTQLQGLRHLSVSPVTSTEQSLRALSKLTNLEVCEVSTLPGVRRTRFQEARYRAAFEEAIAHVSRRREAMGWLPPRALLKLKEWLYHPQSSRLFSFP